MSQIPSHVKLRLIMQSRFYCFVPALTADCLKRGEICSARAKEVNIP